MCSLVYLVKCYYKCYWSLGASTLHLYIISIYRVFTKLCIRLVLQVLAHMALVPNRVNGVYYILDFPYIYNMFHATPPHMKAFCWIYRT
jgi:hypothetical protein